MAQSAVSVGKPSFSEFILSLSWEKTLEIYLQGEHYYAYKSEGEKPKGAVGKLKTYFTRSSKTRIATHFFIFSYFAFAVARSGAQREVGGGAVQYESREGLRLWVAGVVPTVRSAVHLVSALALMPLFVAQKENIFGMSHAAAQAGAATPEEAKKTAEGVKARRSLHGLLGFLLNACTLIMAGSGSSLGSQSVFTPAEATSKHLSFKKAMLLFTVPWLLMVPAVGITGKLKSIKLSGREKPVSLCFPHMMAGNIFLKAFIAVPAARLLGVLFQRVQEALHGQDGVSYEKCYYAGILSSAVCVGAWVAKDIYCILGVARKRYEESLNKQK